MPKVLIENYSTYYDPRTRVHFQPALDRRTGSRVGVADVTEEQAAAYAARPDAFRVLSDEEWVEMTTVPAVPERTEPAKGGDVLTDAGAQAGKAGPPKPPGRRKG